VLLAGLDHLCSTLVHHILHSHLAGMLADNECLTNGGLSEYQQPENIFWNNISTEYHPDINTLLYYTGGFKKSFTTLKAYRNLYRGHTQRFELSKCSKTHRVLPRIINSQLFRPLFSIPSLR
jgi:hypothetical protein